MSPSPTTTGESSAADIPAPVFGVTAQKIISCNQKLQELGINDTIDLARIVVIGDQSTGKSSLIEAISGIVVPKASGLCTKCPIAINLSNASDPSISWHCTVYVDEQFSYNAKKKHITKNNPLGPWQEEKETRTSLIKSTGNPAELSGLIDFAQRMILNPEREPHNPFDANLNTQDTETFSPNTIRLDISAAGWVNLSFVDLPGVISRAGKGNPEYYVEIVESLATKYARDKNNIILLTLPLNHDHVNSRSYSIVEREKVLERTIAVFTKVDLASSDQHQQCIKTYFEAEAEEEFGQGQHAVMLGGQDEHEFFLQAPWNDLPSAEQSKLGIPNLIERIRDILFRQTQQTLPQNLTSIRERLQKVSDLLQQLPTPPDAGELPWKMREQFMAFEGHAKSLFGHGTESRSLLKSRMDAFTLQVAKGKPVLKFKTRTEVANLKDAEARLRAASESETMEIDSDSESDDNNSPKKSAKTRACHFDLEQIYKINKRQYQSDVPGEIEPKAIEELNKLSVQYWEDLLNNFMQNLRKLSIQQTRKCIEVAFRQQKHLPLYQAVLALAERYVEITFEDEKNVWLRKCSAETKTPFTSDNTSLQKYESTILKTHKERRTEARLVVERAIQKADHIGEKKKPKLLDEGSLEEDEWDLELRMSAKTAAYYELASKRFVDNICQDLLTVYIPRLQLDLVTFITRKFGLDDMGSDETQATISELMCEDPEREKERRRLLREQENLKAGYDHIVNVLGPTTHHGQPHNNYTIDLADSFTPSTSTSVSPNKRKVNSANFEPTTPTKKTKKDGDNTSGVGGARIRLPSRARSIDLEH